MPIGRDRLWEVRKAGTSRVVAPVYDALSARVAEIAGWDLCKVSGSVGKAAAFGLPDQIRVASATHFSQVCARITQMSDVSLVVDADDGGSDVQVWQTVRDLEHAGAAAVEIEDSATPAAFNVEKVRHSLLMSLEAFAARCEMALDARTDRKMMIIARTSSLYVVGREEALRRVRQLTVVGVDAVMLPGLGGTWLTQDPKGAIEAIHDVSGLPLCVSGLPDELERDEDWLLHNRVMLRYRDQLPYRMVLKSLHEAYVLLKEDDRAFRRAEISGEVSALERMVAREEEFRALTTRWTAEREDG